MPAPAQSALAHAEGTTASHGSTDALPGPSETWEVWWCYDGWHPVADRLEELLPPWAQLKRIDPSRPLHEQVADARVLIPTTGIVDEASIRAAQGLRLIAQPAAGYNNIAVHVAKELGIPVTIAPGYNSHSVAEAALMMMLMLARRVDAARAAFSARVIGEPIGMELHGKQLGIVGMGNVGRCLAEAARGMGMKVVGVNSKSTAEELQQLLASSDMVSIHCPLSPATKGLIGRQQLAAMKPAAILMNSARGGVIDKQALLEALREGRLAGVGLDVHWVEPADPQDELYKHPKVLALPHLGSITEEVYARFAGILAENIRRAGEGRELLHRLC